ncbi:protein phosphatase 2C [Achlya hypogyna]|uniref:Protein phosphatase 2C n=1 Tax=Achlya hypogyna TaxID=1202772 RepID=A0A1V9YI80_ACHHY|nr:protein phosphatase 2C [Achlya hypogyna]
MICGRYTAKAALRAVARAAGSRALPAAIAAAGQERYWRMNSSVALGISVGLAATATALCDAPSDQVVPDDFAATETPISLSLERQVDVQLSRAVAHVRSYSCASYRANYPIEDRFVVQTNKQEVFAAVIDGHGGWQVAEYTHGHLIENVKNEIDQLHDATAAKVRISIQHGYIRTERQLKEALLPAFQLGFGQVNRVGACTMLAYLRGSLLVLANAGDIRGVLATSDPEGRLLAVPLSNDHNAKILAEKERLAHEHPNEANIVVCKHPESCYVKGGLQPTRALGDFAFKYPEFNASAVTTERGGGRHIAAPYTPPYVDAIPETRAHVLNAADKFLILGSDGVWDFLENDEAVAIVQEHIAAGKKTEAGRVLVERVIARAAELKGKTLKEFAALPPGKERRRVHDDTTVVILFFD